MEEMSKLIVFFKTNKKNMFSPKRKLTEKHIENLLNLKEYKTLFVK